MDLGEVDRCCCWVKQSGDDDLGDIRGLVDYLAVHESQDGPSIGEKPLIPAVVAFHILMGLDIDLDTEVVTSAGKSAINEPIGSSRRKRTRSCWPRSLPHNTLSERVRFFQLLLATSTRRLRLCTSQ